MDAVPGEAHSLAGSRLPGLVVVRSLTKTWALAGLRVGYLLAEPELVRQLGQAQPLWSVSTPALTALDVCSGRGPVAQAQRDAAVVAAERALLQEGLEAIGVEVAPGSQAPFLLCRVPGRPDVRGELRSRGVAVRRGDTFPGLSAEHWRVAVRDDSARTVLLTALADVLAQVT
jgi:histidinol-phosphate aminotransferase